jgi:ASTRA-associated protein 1
MGWPVRMIIHVLGRNLHICSIRLYATRTMKPLGTLKYHKTGCQTLEFARSIPVKAEVKPVENDDDDDSEDEMSENQKITLSRWLVGGGKDNRISVWSLISFSKT